jgi:hypothetical protein
MREARQRAIRRANGGQEFPAVASPDGPRTICVFCVHLRLRNSGISFMALLFAFDAWTKSVKKPMNSQKSRLLKAIQGREEQPEIKAASQSHQSHQSHSPTIHQSNNPPIQ